MHTNRTLRSSKARMCTDIKYFKKLSFGLAFCLSVLASPSHAAMEFSVLSYNVAGLWRYVSQSSPHINHKLISPQLNRFDIVLLQEDFNYHDDLFSKAKHSSKSTHAGAMGFGDGLSRLSMYPFNNYTRQQWQDCLGYLWFANDCLTPKGFSFARHVLPDGVEIDVYNIHADAGSSKKDIRARNSNMSQLSDFINKHSSSRLVILAGDFNSLFNEEGSVKRFLDEGFQDVRERMLNTEFHDEEESIDKILFRGNSEYELLPITYKMYRDEFLDASGEPLSDHFPTFATFELVRD